MAIQFIIGTLLILMTIFIHAFALDRIIMLLTDISPIFFKHYHKVWKQLILCVATILVFCAHIVQMWIWAIFYLEVDVFPSLEEALYFSASSFTTVGFGDIYLGEDWRLISSFEAANGFLLFGWSTAFIYEVMSKLYSNERLEKLQQIQKRFNVSSRTPQR